MAALAAPGKAWELGIAKPSFLLGICRQHVLGAGAAQQLGHRARLRGRAAQGQLRTRHQRHPRMDPRMDPWSLLRGVSATQISPEETDPQAIASEAVAFLLALPRSMG